MALQSRSTSLGAFYGPIVIICIRVGRRRVDVTSSCPAAGPGRGPAVTVPSPGDAAWQLRLQVASLSAVPPGAQPERRVRGPAPGPVSESEVGHRHHHVIGRLRRQKTPTIMIRNSGSTLTRMNDCAD